MLESIGLIVIGLTLLVVGGNALLRSAVSIATRFDIPKAVIGMTVVSMATSFPELVVSLNAALKGNSMIALGNVIGSNISNIGFILSVTALFSTITISKKFFRFDYPILMGVSLVFLVMLLDNDVSRLDGVILSVGFILFIFSLVKRSDKNTVKEVEQKTEDEMPLWKVILFLLVGGLGLWLGAEWLIEGSVAIAKEFGLSDRVIGLTIVAIGTSVPELAASLISIYNKENDISLGNIVGSNIFNILLIMGTVSTISPIEFSDDQSINDAIIMTAFAFLLWPLAMIYKKYTIGWKKGIVLLGLFIYFIYQTIS